MWLRMLVPISLLSGCASGIEKNDWEHKIGHYSLDDAKRELGSPESCVGLDDGGTACSWPMRNAEKGGKLVLTFGPTGQLATASDAHF
jgi:hypothetical protein